MAEPQTATPQEKTGEGNRPATKAGDGERRSFEEAGRGQGAQADKAAEAGRQVARAAGDSGRILAEQTRRGAQDVGEFWRQTLDPFRALNMDVGRMFDDFWRQTAAFGAVPALRPASPFGALSAAPFTGLPPTDVKETDQAYLLSVELPGLEREDVELSLRGDALLISGHKVEEKNDTSTAYRMSERRFGRFERSFPLPADVDRGKIEAQFRNGLLAITLPKAEEARTARASIPIQ